MCFRIRENSKLQKVLTIKKASPKGDAFYYIDERNIISNLHLQHDIILQQN